MKNKKFKEDSEMSQPSAGQPAFTSGRDDAKLEETSAGATGSGSIATVAAPIGKMQKRNKGSIFAGIQTSEKFPNSKAVKEGQISEDDIILMPGQGRKLKPGLMSKRVDNEVEMSRSELYQSAKDAKQVCDMLKSVSEMQGLDGWVQAKITKAADYLSSVRKYLEGKTAEVDEGRGFRGVGGARSREDDEGYSRGRHGDQKAQELEYIKAVQAEKARKEAEKAKQDKGVAEARNGDTNFGSTVTRGSWVVYDGSKVKRFKSREGAKAYAEKNGGKVASSEFYADNIQGKQGVAEGWKETAALLGAPVVAGALAVGAQNYDEQQPHVQIGDKSIRYIAHPGWGTVPFDAMTVKGKDGKEYRIARFKNGTWIAYPPKDTEVKEQSVAEAEQPTSREKFNKGLKKAGYDPEKGANRLFSLLSKQAAEREKFEKELPAVYGSKDKEVDEGIFDRFKKKPEAKPQRMPITAEQRAFIKQYFPTNHNADITWGRKDSGDYVLPDNVNVQYGKGLIAFLNIDGKLIASVAYHHNAQDRANPKATPLLHFEVPVNSGEDLEKLKANLSEGVSEDQDPCWKDYKQLGTKKKNGKTVPNCVPKK